MEINESVNPFDEEPLPPIEAYEQDVSEAFPDPREQSAGEGADLSLTPEELEDIVMGDRADRQRAIDEINADQRKERAALFDRLNERQRQAVLAPHASSLVLAAAGSGKTSVLTARIAHLVSSGNPSIPPRSILAVTFTNKSAQEMRQRLLKLLDRRAVNDIWIGTFHSLCNRLLRENAEAAGLPKSFAILDVDGQEALCRGILKDMGLTRASDKQAAKMVLESRQGSLLVSPETEAARLAGAGAISAAEAGGADGGDSGEYVTPAQCARYISSRKEAGEAPRPPRDEVTTRSVDVEQFEAVYAEYQVRCARASLLDFQDLLTRAVKLLEENSLVKQKVRDRFQAILVDEFQDTNAIQYKWLGLMKGHRAHVTAVGDDDQSIYAFRGAKPENMAHFLRDMAKSADGKPGALVRLEQNYRSLPHILEAANAVIARNTNRLGKTLQTDKPDGGEKIDLVEFWNGVMEASAIADRINGLVKSRGIPPSEIAILYRANQQSRIIESELNKRGIPLTVYGGFRFYERQEVKYALSYLDLVNDLGHDISFAKVANFPPRGLGERTIEELRQDAQLQRISMMALVAKRQGQREESPASIGGAAAVKKQLLLEMFASLVVDLAERAGDMPLHKLIEATIEESGLAAHYAAEAKESGACATSDRLANMAELVSAARQFVLDNPEVEEQHTLSQLTDYLAHVALMTSTSESDMNVKNTVSLMTVHSAKGLEFDHVFVTGLEEMVFPHTRAMQEDATWVPESGSDSRLAELGLADRAEGADHASQAGVQQDGPGVQEERRLMYVALTRARTTLMLSHCKERLINGDIRKFEPSRFIDELPPSRIRFIEGEELVSHGSRQNQRGGAHPGANSSWARKPGQAQKAAPAFDPGKLGQDDANRAAGRASVPAQKQTRIGIVGTAGRDKERAAQMTAAMWTAMLDDARKRTAGADALVSGGAAWADHLAVRLFLEGHTSALALHLPAPIGSDGRFEGPDINAGGSSGAAANYYHDLFLRATGVDGLQEIALAIERGAKFTFEAPIRGYMAMSVRNKKVAAGCERLIAYTWGDGDLPNDGGTKQTWDMARGARKEHVSLLSLDKPTAVERPRMRA